MRDGASHEIVTIDETHVVDACVDKVWEVISRVAVDSKSLESLHRKWHRIRKT